VTPKPAIASPQPLSSIQTPQPSSALATDSTPKILTPRPIPKAKFTPAELADFLRAVEGSDKTKKLLLLDLYARFKSAGSQASIKQKLEEVATKAGTKGSMWKIKPAAWVSKIRPGLRLSLTPIPGRSGNQPSSSGSLELVHLDC
jgi:hypothetical protein